MGARTRGGLHAPTLHTAQHTRTVHGGVQLRCRAVVSLRYGDLMRAELGRRAVRFLCGGRFAACLLNHSTEPTQQHSGGGEGSRDLWRHPHASFFPDQYLHIHFRCRLLFLAATGKEHTGCDQAMPSFPTHTSSSCRFCCLIASLVAAAAARPCGVSSSAATIFFDQKGAMTTGMITFQ